MIEKELADTVEEMLPHGWQLSIVFEPGGPISPYLTLMDDEDNILGDGPIRIKEDVNGHPEMRMETIDEAFARLLVSASSQKRE